MCSIASPASSIASPTGLPISRRISSASSGSRWVIFDFQALRCVLRSPKLRPAHHVGLDAGAGDGRAHLLLGLHRVGADDLAGRGVQRLERRAGLAGVQVPGS